MNDDHVIYPDLVSYSCQCHPCLYMTVVPYHTLNDDEISQVIWTYGLLENEAEVNKSEISSFAYN